jgi:hypothetical protein
LSSAVNEGTSTSRYAVVHTGIVAQNIDCLVLGLDCGGGASDRSKVLEVARDRFDGGRGPFWNLGLDESVGGVGSWGGTVQQQYSLGALAGAHLGHDEPGPRRAARDGDNRSVEGRNLRGFKVGKPHGRKVRVNFLGTGAAHDDQSTRSNERNRNKCKSFVRPLPVRSFGAVAEE